MSHARAQKDRHALHGRHGHAELWAAQKPACAQGLLERLPQQCRAVLSSVCGGASSRQPSGTSERRVVAPRMATLLSRPVERAPLRARVEHAEGGGQQLSSEPDEPGERVAGPQRGEAVAGGGANARGLLRLQQRFGRSLIVSVPGLWRGIPPLLCGVGGCIGGVRGLLQRRLAALLLGLRALDSKSCRVYTGPTCAAASNSSSSSASGSPANAAAVDRSPIHQRHAKIGHSRQACCVHVVSLPAAACSQGMQSQESCRALSSTGEHLAKATVRRCDVALVVARAP